MSSTGPTRARGYLYPPAPAPAIWDRATADTLHGDIHDRLVALEAKRTELQALLDDLSFNAQQRVDETISPIVAAVQADLDGLRTQVMQTLAANQQIIDDFQAVTAVNLEELEEKIAEVEQRIATILAGGIDAADVAESATRVFVTAQERAILTNKFYDGGTF